MAKSRMTEDGVFAQFVPLYLLGKSGTDIIVKTFASVFPYAYGWNVISGSSNLLLLGSLKPLDGADVIRKRVEEYEEGLAQAYQFGAGPETIGKAVMNRNISMNTDDKPIIEFIAARNLISKD